MKELDPGWFLSIFRPHQGMITHSDERSRREKRKIDKLCFPKIRLLLFYFFFYFLASLSGLWDFSYPKVKSLSHD